MTVVMYINRKGSESFILKIILIRCFVVVNFSSFKILNLEIILLEISTTKKEEENCMRMLLSSSSSLSPQSNYQFFSL